MKVNHSSKYDFNSPLKALETEQKGKRAQSSSSGKKNRKLNFSDTGSKAEQSAIIESANPILEERCSYSTPMVNKDNNLKLNSSGKGNKKTSPRISPMTLGEFQITPKLSQGARKKGRKSDPTSIEKSTDK